MNNTASYRDDVAVMVLEKVSMQLAVELDGSFTLPDVGMYMWTSYACVFMCMYAGTYVYMYLCTSVRRMYVSYICHAHPPSGRKCF